MQNRVLIGVVAGIITVGSTAALASWAFVPLEKLVADNPVIVVGKIEKIDVAPPPKANEPMFTYDTAYIAVSKVLKNTLGKTAIEVGDKLPLGMPSVNRRVAMSTDIRYRKGTEGVWLLERRKGQYWATYPRDLQSLKEEGKIAALIAKQAIVIEKVTEGVPFATAADHAPAPPKNALYRVVFKNVPLHRAVAALGKEMDVAIRLPKGATGEALVSLGEKRIGLLQALRRITAGKFWGTRYEWGKTRHATGTITSITYIPKKK